MYGNSGNRVGWYIPSLVCNAVTGDGRGGQEWRKVGRHGGDGVWAIGRRRPVVVGEAAGTGAVY